MAYRKFAEWRFLPWFYATTATDFIIIDNQEPFKLCDELSWANLTYISLPEGIAIEILYFQLGEA